MKFDIENFSSVLIANRGEIACRIIKTAKKCGLKTIVVYTHADNDSPHVKLADKAILIGDGPVTDSYLSIPKIINAALSSKAEAIHPGYGFLSENADFAIACEKNGLIFVGPKSHSIKIMGNKAEAKKIVSSVGVPCIPGSDLIVNTRNEISSIATTVGYPLMIKAVAGGGGKGMRLVNHESELHSALKVAKAEGLNSFGSDEVILERAIISARHVEIQIFGDSYGNVIHLGERDCSVQRRHQKIVEETPCPGISKKTSQSMGDIAVKAAKKIKYIGAGTVEFLLDDTGNFYFLEMNTRLQVEHPVTELVTNLDLVYLQFLIADGQTLPVSQDEVNFNDHAIEIRLCAEDPTKEFLPCSGRLDIWSIKETQGVRVDSGVTAGSPVSPFYDPMLAKVIGYGSTRTAALNNLIDALENASIFGVRNNRNFLLHLLKQKKFRDGSATTSFLEETYPNGFKDQIPSNTEYALVASLIYKQKLDQHFLEATNVLKDLIGWSNQGRTRTAFMIQHLDEVRKIHVTCQGQNNFLVNVGDETIEVLINNNEIRTNGNLFTLVSFNTSQNVYQIVTDETDFCFEEINYLDKIHQSEITGAIRAPMHGIIMDILVSPQARVKVGDCLIILEAMKMQHELIASFEGFIGEIFVTVGQQVSIDHLLIEIKPG